jgi:hypothetical protein
METIRIFHNDGLFTGETATKDQDDLVRTEELGHLQEMDELGEAVTGVKYGPGSSVSDWSTRQTPSVTAAHSASLLSLFLSIQIDTRQG